MTCEVSLDSRFMNSKFMKLENIHTNQNDLDMMTKILLSDKLQAYCKIAGMAVPSYESKRDL